MHRKMFSFSTLQRPTQEEKERKRRFREEQRRAVFNGINSTSTLPSNKSAASGRVGRAMTFRDMEDKYYGGFGGHSLIEALRIRARSANARYNPDHNENYLHHSLQPQSNLNSNSRRREQSAGSRLRFLADEDQETSSSRLLRWNNNKASEDNMQNSSGYSSGGGGGNVVNGGLNVAPEKPARIKKSASRGRNNGNNFGGENEISIVDGFDIYATSTKRANNRTR